MAAKIEVLLFGAKLGDNPFAGGLNAISEGVTSSHIAMRLTFDEKDRVAYEKEYKDLLKSPNAKGYIHEVTDNGEKKYELYLSFGPAGSGPSLLPKAALDSGYEFNTTNSLWGTAIPADTMASEMGLSRTTSVQSPIPGLGVFTKKDINLGPLSIIRFTPETKGAIEKFQTSILKSEQKYLATKAASDYTAHYQNVDDQFKILRDNLRPNMPMEQFMYEFNKNIGTIGLPERVAYTVNLVDDPAKGFNLGGALKELTKVFNNLDNDHYNLVFHNCANFVTNMLVKSTTNPDVQNALLYNAAIPGLVDTPVSNMKGLINALETVESIANKDSKEPQVRGVKRAFSGGNESVLEANTSKNNEAVPKVKLAPDMKRKLSELLNTPANHAELVAEDNHLKSRPQPSPNANSLHLSFKRNGKPLESLLQYASKNDISVQTFKLNESENVYVFFDKNRELARGSYNKDQNTTNFELPVPLDPHESTKILEGIKKNMPKVDNISFKISAGVNQTEDVEKLKTLLMGEFKSAKVEVEQKKPVPKLKGQVP